MVIFAVLQLLLFSESDMMRADKWSLLLFLLLSFNLNCLCPCCCLLASYHRSAAHNAENGCTSI